MERMHHQVFLDVYEQTIRNHVETFNWNATLLTRLSGNGPFQVYQEMYDGVHKSFIRFGRGVTIEQIRLWMWAVGINTAWPGYRFEIEPLIF